MSMEQSLQSRKPDLLYDYPIMSLNENKHRANCCIPSGECAECVLALERETRGLNYFPSWSHVTSYTFISSTIDNILST